MPREAVQTKCDELRPASRMRAAVLYGSEDLRIEEVDVPSIGADEILLRVRVALTDGTDLKVWKRGYHARMIQPPAIFGHEVTGEIAAAGPEVAPRWQAGMRVVPANSAPCLTCFYCRRGQENLCEDLLFNNGAYAEYLRIPARIVQQNLLEVPDRVSDLDAALAEPLACVLRGIEEIEVAAGGPVVVIGCGPIGLTFVRLLTHRGAQVIALAKREEHLETARRLGAAVTVNVAETPDPVRAVRKLTAGGRGADSVVEAAGTTTTWQWALAMVRRGGVVNLFSGLPRGARMEIEPAAIHYSEITVKSTFHHTPRHFREALGVLARGEFSAGDLVSREIRLADLPGAFEKMKSGRSVMKLAVRP